MPSQLRSRRSGGSSHRTARSNGKMVAVFLCVSSFSTSVKAFARHPSSTRSAAFVRSMQSSERLLTKGQPASRWFSPTKLASASTAEPPVAGYDVINKERGLESYDPSSFERDIYEWWENSGCFDPDAKQKPFPGQKDSYVLPMPPPNVTGRLHMGHAIFVALQDVLARFHRMRGRPVLWLPGM